MFSQAYDVGSRLFFLPEPSPDYVTLVGVSEKRGPQNSTLNSRILSIRTQNKVPLISGNSIMGRGFITL